MRYAIVLVSFFLVVHGAIGQPGIWTESLNISNNNGRSQSPAIEVDYQGNIHLTCADNARLGGGGSAANMDILYRYFNGQVWSPCQQLSDSASTYSAGPAIALDGLQRCHVVWYDNWYIYEGYYAEILYSCKADSQWSAPLVLSEVAHYNHRPDIAADASNRLHVVWYGVLSGGTSQILYRVFDGNQWLPIQCLTSMPNGCNRPKIKIY